MKENKMDYVKDGTLTIQARTIKEVNSIDRVVVYADGCQREYLMPLPEERKEGEWVKNEHGLKCCSVCRKRPLQICYYDINYDGYTSKDILSKHCPNCGAKMKGEERWI